MILMNGRKVAEKILEPVKKQILNFEKKRITICLAIILVGKEDPNSLTYIREKRKKAKEIGVQVILYKLKSETKVAEVKRLIQKLNKDPNIHGILIQLPLPKHIDSDEVLRTINQKKDVDGLTPNSPYNPACATGIMEILSFYKIPIKDKKVVILGAGRIVGNPLFKLMQNAGADVIIVHSKTENIREKTKKADILIGATPIQNIIKEDMVKKDAIVIDAAKNVDSGVNRVASYLTPKIGGVGPVTVAELLKNTALAVKNLTDS